jgi:hypothetical protein
MGLARDQPGEELDDNPISGQQALCFGLCSCKFVRHRDDCICFETNMHLSNLVWGFDYPFSLTPSFHQQAPPWQSHGFWHPLCIHLNLVVVLFTNVSPIFWTAFPAGQKNIVNAAIA